MARRVQTPQRYSFPPFSLRPDRQRSPVSRAHRSATLPPGHGSLCPGRRNDRVLSGGLRQLRQTTHRIPCRNHPRPPSRSQALRVQQRRNARCPHRINANRLPAPQPSARPKGFQSQPDPHERIHQERRRLQMPCLVPRRGRGRPGKKRVSSPAGDRQEEGAPSVHPGLKRRVLQDGVVLTDFRGEAPAVCLAQPNGLGEWYRDP